MHINSGQSTTNPQKIDPITPKELAIATGIITVIVTAALIGLAVNKAHLAKVCETAKKCGYDWLDLQRLGCGSDFAVISGAVAAFKFLAFVGTATTVALTAYHLYQQKEHEQNADESQRDAQRKIATGDLVNL